ncbi:MAG: SMUG2 DNA glycosylase family protein [Niabella sp.]
MKTIADKVIAFNGQLQYAGLLPSGFGVMNPFKENPETMEVMAQFYYKFYNDNKRRKFLIGINPSRHGAGLTGVPFTDTKRLDMVCGIKMKSAYSHEPSSVFLYEMIQEYGGAQNFYSNIYINSPFPLAIIRRAGNGNWLNANYYDDRVLFEAVKPFMVKSLKQHIQIGVRTDKAYVLGKKNLSFLEKINREEKLFGELVCLEHPRYIQQYKSKDKAAYIEKYLAALLSD